MGNICCKEQWGVTAARKVTNLPHTALHNSGTSIGMLTLISIQLRHRPVPVHCANVVS